MAIKRFPKQPGDTLDYDIDFTDWFGEEADSIVSYTTPTIEPAGLTLVTHAQNGFIVKVFVSGGTPGNSYKITTRITTAVGRIKEREIVIRVKEI